MCARARAQVLRACVFVLFGLISFRFLSSVERTAAVRRRRRRCRTSSPSVVETSVCVELVVL